MPKTQLILGVTFLGVFGAGAVSALVADRYLSRSPVLPPPSSLRVPDGSQPGPATRPHSYIAQRLGLTPEQHEAMDRLWNATRERMGQQWAQRRALQQEREEALQKLLSDSQRQQMEEINARYDAKIAEIREATEALMRDADKRTREILTPEQQVRYDEMQRERQAREDGGGRGRGPGGGGGPGGGERRGGGPGGGGPGPLRGPGSW